MDCFHEGPNYLVIAPDECIDCALCEPECPVEAIVSEDDLMPDQYQFLALNETLSNQWPVINASKKPLENADERNGEPNKLQFLEK